MAKILATWPNVKPLRVMFQDEARFGRLSRCRYGWAKRPLRPLVKAMLTHQSVYAYGAVSIADSGVDSLLLPPVNGPCRGRFLNEIAPRYPQENIIMVQEGAGWHKNQAMGLPANLKHHFLSPYSPELNPVEHRWDELREKHFHHRAFETIDALEDTLVAALRTLELDQAQVQNICHWDWIINVTSIAN